MSVTTTKRAEFARGITRSEFKGRYATPLDLAIARGEIRIVVEADRQIRGAGRGIRAWRAEVHGRLPTSAFRPAG